MIQLYPTLLSFSSAELCFCILSSTKYIALIDSLRGEMQDQQSRLFEGMMQGERGL